MRMKLLRGEAEVRVLLVCALLFEECPSAFDVLGPRDWLGGNGCLLLSPPPHGSMPVSYVVTTARGPRSVSGLVLGWRRSRRFRALAPRSALRHGSGASPRSSPPVGGRLPIVMVIPRAWHSSSALSTDGRCPFLRARNAFDGSFASLAASSSVMFRRVSSASMSRFSRSLVDRFTCCVCRAMPRLLYRRLRREPPSWVGGGRSRRPASRSTGLFASRSGLDGYDSFVSLPGSGTGFGASIPIVIEMPTALQSSSARSIVGRFPLRSSDWNTVAGSRASRAASAAVMPRRFRAASIWCFNRSVDDRFTVFSALMYFLLAARVAVGSERVSALAFVHCPLCCGRPGDRRTWGVFVLGDERNRTGPLCVGVLQSHHARQRPGSGPRPTSSLAPGSFCRLEALVMDAKALLSSVREQLGAVDQRCDQLRRELAALDLERGRLESAVSVIQQHVEPASRSAPSTKRAPRHLTDRVLDALDVSGTRRAELVKQFVGEEVTEGALDGALHRLTDRGAIRREDGRIFRVVQSADSVGADVPSGSAPAVSGTDSAVSGSLRTGGSDSVQDLGSAPRPGRRPARGDKPFLTVRVREAIAEGHASTRRELIRYFASQGVKSSSIDDALRGLRKRGLIERHSGGRITVSAPSASGVS